MFDIVDYAKLSEWRALPKEENVPYIRIRGGLPSMRYKIANIPTVELNNVSPKIKELNDKETDFIIRLIQNAPQIFLQLDAMYREYIQGACSPETEQKTTLLLDKVRGVSNAK